MRPEKSVDITARSRDGLPRNRVSISGKLKRFFSCFNHSDRLWGPPGLFIEFQVNCLWGKGEGGVKLTPHLLPEASLRMIGTISYGLSHICFLPCSRDNVCFNPYPTAFPYGNGMVLHFYQQQESSTTKTVHKFINKGLKTYV